MLSADLVCVAGMKHLIQQIAERVKQLSGPYPECTTSKDTVAPGVHPGGDGVNPTVALQHR
jgi:hypothetical protein